MRVGIGYDAHALVEGRRLVLGGVELPHDKGLLGHSDSDVLIHALCDALLGALGAGDIGQHFPDTDMQYKDISSVFFLEKIRELLHERKYKVVNIDTIVIAAEPKIMPHADNMKQNIARALDVDPSSVNIKATTTEGLGFTGEKKGIAAHAIVSIVSE